MKRFLLSTIITFTVILGLTGQDHKHAIGGRLGLSSGITYQYNIDQFRGYKGMMSFRDGGIQITTLIESTRPIYTSFTDKLYYYIGIGAHVGFTRWQPRNRFFSNPFNRPYSGTFAPVIGLDAIAGIEYRLKRAPISFCIDAKPFFEFFGQNIFRLELLDIGLTMKFTFN